MDRYEKIKRYAKTKITKIVFACIELDLKQAKSVEKIYFI